jgi:hypothetical protein
MYRVNVVSLVVQSIELINRLKSYLCKDTITIRPDNKPIVNWK